MWTTPRALAAAAVAALALGTGACASEGSAPPASTETVTATTTATSPAGRPSADAPTDGRTAEADAGGADQTLEVTAQGDQGVLALQFSGEVPPGQAGPGSGKLITGPGGCFSFVGAGAPHLAIFPPEATFVLQNGKPSVTVDGVEHAVGREWVTDTTELSREQVSGVPDRCGRGAADTVLVVR